LTFETLALIAIASPPSDAVAPRRKDSLGLGYGGFRPGPSRQMKRAMLTPRTTTHSAELTTVRA